MSAQQIISTKLKQEFHRRVRQEGIFRIKKCLNLLTEDQVWHKPNSQLTSIGNLVLHLNGNASQWILSTFGDHPDIRNRDEEFKESSKCSKAGLVKILDELDTNLTSTINKLSDHQLVAEHDVQCYKESGVSILVHVIEHFSYHVGQITFYTKFLLDVDTGYYAEDDLNRSN